MQCFLNTQNKKRDAEMDRWMPLKNIWAEGG